VFNWYLIGKLNFHGYLISRFHSTRKIRENFVHISADKLIINWEQDRLW